MCVCLSICVCVFVYLDDEDMHIIRDIEHPVLPVVSHTQVDVIYTRVAKT